MINPVVVGVSPSTGEPYIVIDGAGQHVYEERIAQMVEEEFDEDFDFPNYFLANIILSTDGVVPIDHTKKKIYKLSLDNFDEIVKKSDVTEEWLRKLVERHWKHSYYYDTIWICIIDQHLTYMIAEGHPGTGPNPPEKFYRDPAVWEIW